MRQVLFALICAAALFHQAMGAPDALDGHVAERQVEFAFQAGRTESGRLAAQGEDLLLDLGRSFLRRAMRSAAVFLQAGRAALLVASPPLAHGERAGAEEPGGGLDAALADRGDQPQAVIVGASHFTNQIEVADEHRAAILAARAARLLPPSAGRRNPKHNSNSIRRFGLTHNNSAKG